MIVTFHRKFLKCYNKADVYIRKKVDICLSDFQQDPWSDILNNHPLMGKREGERTINVTGDWRIVFKELSGGNYELVELIELWTHSQLYG